MSSPRSRMGKPPQPAKCGIKILEELFVILDATEEGRQAVFDKAGYSPDLASKYAHGRLRMHVQTLIDVAQSVGYEIKLVKI